MKSWSEIPSKILNLVTVYYGRDRTQVKWMFVNKHWFTFYLSQVYSTIKTSLIRYFSAVNDNFAETTERAFEVFCSQFIDGEILFLNIKVKSLRELSLQLAETSEVFGYTFLPERTIVRIMIKIRQ